MKKKLCSLLLMSVILLSGALVSLNAEAEIARLEPYEFFQDFEDESITTGDYVVTDIEGLTGVPLTHTVWGGALPEGQTVKIVQEESGNKMIAVTATQLGDSIGTTFSLPTPLNVGKLEASFEFKADATSDDSWSFFAIYSESGTSFSTISYQSGAWKEVKTGVIPGKNANGNFVLRVEATRASAPDAWKLTIYDESGAEPKVIFEKETEDSFGKVAKIKPIGQFSQNQCKTGYFDNYKIKVTTYPAVKNDDDGLNDAKPFAESMVIGFNAAIETPPEDKVVIVKADDENFEIKAETEYDEETGRLTVKPTRYLAYDTEYILKFKEQNIANHIFRTANAPFTFEQTVANPYEPENGAAQAELPSEGFYDAKPKVKIYNNSNETKSFVAMHLLYDENGVIVRALQRAYDDIAAGGNATYTLSIRDVDATKVKSSKIIVWELTEGGGYLPRG